jgi:hypothetical protein
MNTKHRKPVDIHVKERGPIKGEGLAAAPPCPVNMDKEIDRLVELIYKCRAKVTGRSQKSRTPTA